MKLDQIWNKLNVLFDAVWSIVLYFIIEAISRHSVPEAFAFAVGSPLVFLYNAGILLFSFLFVYLFKRRMFVRYTLSAIWLTLGIINGVILANRVTPFTGPDLKNLTEGKAVMTKYLSTFQCCLIYAGFALGVVLLIILFIRSSKYTGWYSLIASLVLIAVGGGCLFGATKYMLQKRLLSNYFGNIAFAYEDYGYPYCLLTTVFNTGISQPMGYSEKEIRRIVDRSNKKAGETDPDSRPNIIFLQLESFMDPELVTYLDMSEDPIPVFRQLMKDYSSGYYKVPSVGAGTANTEFETITGMSLHYFGPGEYPYKSILKDSTCESAAYLLKDLGYSTHAIHNNEANFYSRKTVFPMLGFDTFTSEEYMPEEGQQNPLGWVKDCVLTDEILKCLEYSEDPDYIYCISVQGHGDYPDEPILEDPEITVSGAPTPEMNCKWEYYVNQIHEMDCFIGELIQALKEYPEDVILVMYGDHLPTMNLRVEDMKNRYLFQTQYVMWDNMGLEKKDENLAAYQMAAEVLKRVGIHEGNVMRFHQTRRNSKNYQVDLEMLQYDMLYGKKYVYPDGVSPYEPTLMRLGLYDVTLDSVEMISGTAFTYYFRGTNFTPSSQVKINGDWYETVYISPTMLLISGTELTDFTRLSVAQRSNSSTHKQLSKSRDRAYYAVSGNNKWIS